MEQNIIEIPNYKTINIKHIADALQLFVNKKRLIATVRK